ncbi:MAG TPA: hypothetical protein VK957_18660 [Lunatimonas sp.]|nr:hypothetical protein [Lunatimonas sp.]
MKNIFVFVLVCIPLFHAYAQDTSNVSYQAAYFEVGGAGLIYTFNYDFRFDKSQMDSWGMKVGAGGYWINDSGFFSVPLEINKLFGKGPHYFEIGAGVTFMAFKSNYYEWTCNDNGCFSTAYPQRTEIVLPINGSPNAMGTMNIGYRRIPVDGGISWKINLTPLYNSNGFWPLFAGAGIGYAF